MLGAEPSHLVSSTASPSVLIGGSFIKEQLKRLLLALPGFEALCRRLTRGYVRVLMFHRFASDDGDNPRHLPADVFVEQMDFLALRHPVWTPDEQLAALRDPSLLPATPPVVLTIDDGYRDFYAVAYPVLRRFGLQATVFVTTGFVSGDTWFWWDRLAYILAHASPGRRELRYAGETAWGDPADSAMRPYLWNRIADHLSTIADRDKEEALADLAGTCRVEVPVAPPADYAAVTWDQAAEMGEHGISFEAHTYSHPVLSRVDLERAREEIVRSRQDIETHLGHMPHWFCYPQGGPGDYLPETVALVRELGFTGCYTAFADPDHDGDPLTLPRTSISADMTHFRWVLCGAEHLFMRMKRRLGA